MFKTLITFGLGVYVGVYVAQNYEIQRVDDPQQIASKVMKFLEEKAKDPTKK